MKLLYFVALPYTEEILNLVTLFSINIRNNNNLVEEYEGELGLFIYRTGLALEFVDHDAEWLLEVNDALQVLALYGSKDLNGVCDYLNNIPDKPFTACIDTYYLTYMF